MATDTHAKSVHNTLTNALDLTVTNAAPALFGAAAKWDRVLTADELARLPVLMGA